MSNAQYVVVNSNGEYFVKMNEQLKIIFTKNIEEAAKMDNYEAKNLIPIIAFRTGLTCVLEQV